MPTRVIIMGAAGRDFHNFNTVFRDDPSFEVVAFTAAQIPNIAGRRYPAELAGVRYPDGIPIEPEQQLTRLVRDLHVDVVVFSYSDVPHEHVMHAGSEALAAGADYLLLGPRRTMVGARVPVVAVCATRTGSGKSPTTRRVASLLGRMGKQVVVVRHPMPYGDLAAMAVQRFGGIADLDRYQPSIEEREEYEPLLAAGLVVYAGVDYEAILRRAEQEADVIVWDGGNNDFPFYSPDLLIAVTDPHRADHALRYHPGETVLRMADVVLINKVDTAGLEQIETAMRVAAQLAPDATVIEAASPIVVDDPDAIRGRRVLVVEDGPTITHGGMAFGAGWIAARRYRAGEIIDPRPYAVGALRATFAEFPHLGPVLPAMGYGQTQIDELALTIEGTPADLVLVATPVDLRRLVDIGKPALRVRYELQEIGEPTLAQVLARAFAPVEASTARPPGGPAWENQPNAPRRESAAARLRRMNGASLAPG